MQPKPYYHQTDTFVRWQRQNAQGWRMWDVKTQVELNARWERSYAIDWRGIRRAAPAGLWEVAGTQGRSYLVELSSTAHRCSCPDAQNPRRPAFGWCKHQLAVWRKLNYPQRPWTPAQPAYGWPPAIEEDPDPEAAAATLERVAA